MGIPTRRKSSSLPNIEDNIFEEKKPNVSATDNADYRVVDIDFGKERLSTENLSNKELKELMDDENRVRELATSIDVKADENPIRQTKKWKRLYKENLASLGAMKSGKKASAEAYLKMIDRLASAPPVNQHNIMASFPSFASPNFKYTSERIDD